MAFLREGPSEQKTDPGRCLPKRRHGTVSCLAWYVSVRGEMPSISAAFAVLTYRHCFRAGPISASPCSGNCSFGSRGGLVPFIEAARANADILGKNSRAPLILIVSCPGLDRRSSVLQPKKRPRVTPEPP